MHLHAATNKSCRNICSVCWCVMYLTSLVLSGPLLWFCRKRQPSLASLWTISSLDRSSLSCRMHLFPCCSPGDTENMYLRPQSHDIADWLLAAGFPPGTTAEVLNMGLHNSIKMPNRGDQLKNECRLYVRVVSFCHHSLSRFQLLYTSVKSTGASVELQVSLCVVGCTESEWQSSPLRPSDAFQHPGREGVS